VGDFVTYFFASMGGLFLGGELGKPSLRPWSPYITDIEIQAFLVVQQAEAGR
jgi:hypothetical protein